MYGRITPSRIGERKYDRALSSEGCNALAAKGAEVECRERHTVFARRKDCNLIGNFITMLRL